MKNTILTIAIVAATLLPAAAGAKAPKAKKTKAPVVENTVNNERDSIQAIADKAKAGDAAAQNEVGIWFYKGDNGQTQDYKKAAEWFSRAARQENAQAIGNLALCYQKGHGVETDSITALKLYIKSLKEDNKNLLANKTKSAQKGVVFDNVLLGFIYETGQGAKKSLDRAKEYYTVAAEKGSVDASRRLAMIYQNEKNFKEASKWFAKGAAKNDITCTYWYGKNLLDGRGVKKDAKAGADYLLKAANAGMPQAMYEVGNCYFSGNGLMPNKEQALNWYAKAAGKGVVEAQWKLGECYRTGDDVAVNYDLATRYYAMTCAKNKLSAKFKSLIKDSIPDSPYVVYLKGLKEYNAKDFEAALKSFKAVSKAKVIDGKVMEGTILANNNYKKNNPKKGAKLLQECVKAGDPQAAYLLATLYELGKGVEKDMPKAIELLNQAADANYGPAECSLGDIFFEGRTIERDYAAATALYLRAEEQGNLNANAAKRLAECYTNGWGVDKNEARAKEILKGDYSSPVNALLKLVD